MRNRPLILASLLLAAFAINLDTTIVNVALPTLVRTLHASNAQLQWIVDAYNLVFAALLLACGSLSDRLGLALSAAAMALLIYTIIEAPNQGWSSARSLLGFALAALLFALFVSWERRVPAPMLDIALFRNPRFTAASGSVTIAFFALF